MERVAKLFTALIFGVIALSVSDLEDSKNDVSHTHTIEFEELNPQRENSDAPEQNLLTTRHNYNSTLFRYAQRQVRRISVPVFANIVHNKVLTLNLPTYSKCVAVSGVDVDPYGKESPSDNVARLRKLVI